MKKLVVIALFSLSFFGFSQDLIHKIPSDALVVASIDGKHIQDFISINDLNQYSFVQKLFTEADENIKSIKDFGVDVNADAYYYTQIDSTTTYHCFMVKLADVSAFERLLSEDDLVKKTVENGVNMILESDAVVLWNANTLFITQAIFPRKAFDWSQYDYEEAVVEEEVEEVEYDSNEVEAEPRIEDSETAGELVIEEEVEEVEASEDYSDTPPNFEEIEGDTNNRDKMQEHALAVFNGIGHKSVALNANYNKGKDKDAIAYFWIRNYGELIDLYYNSTKSLMGGTTPFSNMSFKDIYGIDALKFNMFIEEDGFRVKMESDFNNKRLAANKRLYDSKLDKSFYKYFDQNQVLAYMSMSVNGQAALEESPNIYAAIVNGMVPQFGEEADLGADFLSILLDEEAIAELFTGDVLFILSDLGEKEIEYTTYEYDDDWNSTEVTKTKKQVLPEFTMMFGSENSNFTNKLLNIGKKYKVINRKQFYSEVTVPDLPIPLFLMHKDDIFFVSTSEKDMIRIATGTYQSNTGRHKKMMKKNIMTFYINNAKIIEKIPTEDFDTSDLEILKYVKDNFTETSMTSSRIKGNHMYGEYIVKTSNKKENALKVLLELIEMAAK